MNELIKTGIMVAALNPLVAEASVVKGSAEILAGQNNTTLDTKVLVAGDKANIFHRDRMSTNYDGETSDFHYLAAHYVPMKGLALGGGVWGTTSNGVKPHIVAQYMGNTGDLSYLQLVSLRSDPQLKFLTNVSYSPELNDDLSLLIEVENVSIFGKEGHEFSTQRLRSGLESEKYQFGIGADLVEVADSFGYNLGGFIERRF